MRKNNIIIKVLLVLILCTTVSCNYYENRVKLNNLEVKNAEIDYLDRVYTVKKTIELKEKIRVLDSIIDDINYPIKNKSK